MNISKNINSTSPSKGTFTSEEEKNDKNMEGSPCGFKFPEVVPDGGGSKKTSSTNQSKSGFNQKTGESMKNGDGYSLSKSNEQAYNTRLRSYSISFSSETTNVELTQGATLINLTNLRWGDANLLAGCYTIDQLERQVVFTSQVNYDLAISLNLKLMAKAIKDGWSIIVKD